MQLYGIIMARNMTKVELAGTVYDIILGRNMTQVEYAGI
jgi:hypothetical protein